jgi:anaerobic magnesium-protoporphyrin IX monomethyl ester cyclase
MKITLIAPRLSVAKRELLHSRPHWPLKLAIFAAFLQNQNEELSVLDLFGIAPTQWEDRGQSFLQGIPFGRCLKSRSVLNAELAVVDSGTEASFPEVLGILKVLRFVRPDLKIAVLENAEHPPSPSQRQALCEVGADFLLCGECHDDWNEVRAFVLSSTRQIPPSVWVRSSLKEPPRSLGGSVDYPIPAWDLFPIQNYWKLPYSALPRRTRYFPVLTSHQIERDWFGRMPRTVVDEICLLKDRYGVRHFQVEDQDLAFEAERWPKICERLLEKSAAIHFYFVGGVRAETIPLEQIRLFAQAGCRSIALSAESDRKSIDELNQACRRVGILTRLPLENQTTSLANFTRGTFSLAWLLFKHQCGRLIR